MSRGKTESLAWMVEDGVANSVGCKTEIAAEETMNITVTIQRPDGGNDAYAYEIKWMATDGI